MAEAQGKPFNFGSLVGTVYDFPATGDALPMHKHTAEDVHITVVARGSFRAHGDSFDMTVKAGDVVDWKVDQNHELVALEPNSRIVNIVKGA